MDYWAQLLLVNRVLEVAPLMAFAAAWVRRRHIPYEFKPIYYYVGGESIIWFLDRISRITIHNNIYLYHLSTILMVVFLTQAYHRLLPDSRVRRAIWPSLSLFLVVALLDATWLSGLFTLINSYSNSFGCVILLVLAMVHVASLTLHAPFTPFEKQPAFFLDVSVLLYCSCSVINSAAYVIIYRSGYDLNTRLRMDRLFSFPDILTFAVAMGLLTWMFCFYPLSTDPRQALPKWLHYSRWRPRPFLLLYQPLAGQLRGQELQKC